MKKKLIAILSVIAMCAAFTGCGETESVPDKAETPVAEQTAAETSAPEKESVQETEAEETEAEEPDAELDDALQELADVLAGTCWVGTDADRNIFALGFGDEDVALSMVTSEGQTDLEGYWGINESIFGIYSDAELTDELCTFNWEITGDDDTTFIQLDDAVLALTDPDEIGSLAEAVAQMNLTNAVIEHIADGTYWFGADDELAVMMMINGTDSFYGVFGSDGSGFSYTGNWGMDYDNIYFIDDETGNVMTYEWNMAEDGSTFSLITENGTELVLEASDVTEINDALEFLDAYYSAAE